MNWEDRLTSEQRDQFAAALDAFEDHRDLDTLYEGLLNAGLEAEEAEEYVNLMVEGGEF